MKRVDVPIEFTTEDGRLVSLRRLREADLSAVLRFANELVRERETNPVLGIVSLDRRMTRGDEEEFLLRMIMGVRRREGVSLAAFANGKMVGHCNVSRLRPKDVRHTGVFGLTVIRDYRGLGIGKKISTEVLREAARIGIWLVELTVFATNERAIHLYEDRGFKRVGTVPNKILRRGRHTDEIVMYADLRGSDKFPLKARDKS